MSDAAFQIGAMFAGRYRIDGLLGRGGMGAVYAAFDEVLQDRVALKVLSMKHVQALPRFQREVRLSRRVTSPHVARTYDIGSHDGVHYLTMELIDGESLRQRMRRDGALSFGEVVRIGRALAAGLASAHEASVMHRDLKPGNVMLERGGRVVITDFGLARSLEAVDDGLQTRGVVGTPRYMAPEVIGGHAPDERTDLHALGLVLAELRTGKRASAFSAPTEITRVAQIPGVPSPEADDQDQLDSLISELMSFRPEDRPKSAAQVLERLNGIEQGLESAVVPTRSAASIPRASQRIAVLPFTGRGTDEAKELAEVLSEELVDVLSHNRGVQVLAHTTSATVAAEDAASAGQRVGADWVVGGTVTGRPTRDGAAPQLRVTVRLIASADGAQLYSERFDVEAADVFEVQDHIARRIGEALRVEVTLVARRGDADAVAIAHYLHARRLMSSPTVAPGKSLPDLEAAIARAPGFAVAIAAHALDSVRRWFSTPRLDQGGVEESAARSVERALAHAGDLAETHLAAGILGVQRGNYRTGAAALRRAIEIAPTCALAHEYLGRLECESGQGERGIRRVDLAHTLDPNAYQGLIDKARWLALGGRVDEATAVLDRLDQTHGPPGVQRLQIRMRIAAWYGDMATVARCVERLSEGGAPQVGLLQSYGAAALGLGNIDEYIAAVREYLACLSNQRFGTYVTQIASEVLCIVGRVSDAVDFAWQSAHMALADIDWLDRCPVIGPVREDPRYAEIRRLVRERADAIWRE